MLTGVGSPKRMISKDPETRARVERAFGGFRVDMLRKGIEVLESEKGGSGMWGDNW